MELQSFANIGWLQPATAYFLSTKRGISHSEFLKNNLTKIAVVLRFPEDAKYCINRAVAISNLSNDYCIFCLSLQFALSDPHESL